MLDNEDGSERYISYNFLMNLNFRSDLKFKGRVGKASNVYTLEAPGNLNIAKNWIAKLPPNIPIVPHKAVAEVSKIGNL